MSKDFAKWGEWKSQDYLKEFYSSEITDDELETIPFLVKVAKYIDIGQKILEFGCGPTLHHIFPFTPHALEVHMVDYLKTNLDEIQKWVNDEKDAHKNWDRFISYALKCEGNKNPSLVDIENRKSETRNKITEIIQADARKKDPLGKAARESYPVVISCYCADSATDNHEDFKLFINNITSLVKPGGIFVTTCLRKAEYYRVGSRFFPSSNVDEDLLRGILEVDFMPESIKMEIRELPAHKEQGYSGIILAYATKR